MNIPKKIHYCWFGGAPKSELINRCIESWKKNLKDYEIIEWNETNFDLNMNNYVKQAYELKKWAFITDFVRLYVLYNYGGIYMDTDMEVLKSLDCFLQTKAFTGFEKEEYPITGIMGSIPQSQVIKRLLDYYENRDFVINGNIDFTTNTKIITDILHNEYNAKLDNSFQILKDGEIHIYPKDYFCPKDHNNGKIRLTNNTYAIHHFNGSWMSDRQKLEKKIRAHAKKILGPKFFNLLSKPYTFLRGKASENK